MTVSEVREKAMLAQEAAAIMNRMTTEQKNKALLMMADALLEHQEHIIAANGQDLSRGRDNGTSVSLLDRLALDSARIAGIAEGLRQIAALPDPVGTVLDDFQRPNGLSIRAVRVPLGVIGMIYEARPNVTVDAAGLCLKTGNCVVLRGGSAALESNRAIVAILKQALEAAGLPQDAIALIEDSDRASVNEMLKLNGLLDVVIPRGGASLIRNVVENATVPVIETGAGICHTYIDESALPDMGSDIAFNAKVQRPSVCNAMETLLVHSSHAGKHLPALAARLREAGVELKGCSKSQAIVDGLSTAEESDYATEYNDYILNIRIVENLDEALAHIRQFGTKHSECIVTENAEHAERFMQEVDAAAVYHNASTRFTDGFEFGFGAEIGISTQKLHARGPMGLPALTSMKYRIAGSGQIRG
ncbi:glutamate-5-semialdehyde dehydrogenase [Paenibacillus sp. J5C_2022]|uniref:glutamate-5-semialdehyde dehydrogenase n=1 Tax=Paenibacillus sp. J5C2022 TaxID=2977129 RepID=UPI0021CF75DA|nr:glutamate-5-semialdehyde dehydrogenase [Paenibacillus sp. J5C2022]MCU6708300.1 glutamate-5-semialdehyde dehydrogenase [Paenibacillus sp. J5C2022]